MRSIQKLSIATGTLAIALLGASIGVGQPPGGPGPPSGGGTASQPPPCNDLMMSPVPIGYRCNDNQGSCPSYDYFKTGGGCELHTTIAGRLMIWVTGDNYCKQGQVGIGYHCIPDPEKTDPCLFLYTCVPGSIPNPSHDPEDPSSPVILSVCKLGERGDMYWARHPPASPDCTVTP